LSLHSGSAPDSAHILPAIFPNISSDVLPDIPPPISPDVPDILPDLLPYLLRHFGTPNGIDLRLQIGRTEDQESAQSENRHAKHLKLLDELTDSD